MGRPVSFLEGFLNQFFQFIYSNPNFFKDVVKCSLFNLFVLWHNHRDISIDIM